MSKHTPGPWTIATGDGCFVVETSETKVHFIVNGETKNVDLDNACLIAAAPELLNALCSVHRWMDAQADGQSKGGHATFDLLMLREQRDIARAAIAKATGETK